METSGGAYAGTVYTVQMNQDLVPDVEKCTGRAIHGNASEEMRASTAALSAAEYHYCVRNWIPRGLDSASIDPTAWMVFMDQVGVGRQICTQLRGAGHEVIEVTPGRSFTRLGRGRYVIKAERRADYDALISDVSVRGRTPEKILHLWSLSDNSSHASVEEILDLGFFSLLCLGQVLGEHDMPGLDICVVSNGLHSVTGEATSTPAKAVLLGPVRVIPKAFPALTVRSVDCDPFVQGSGYVALQIIAEHCAAFKDPVVAYRAEERWVESAERLDLSRDSYASRLKEGATYLITSGMSDLGLTIAESLATNWHARIILVDELVIPAAAKWTDALRSEATPNSLKAVIARLLKIQSSAALMTIPVDIRSNDELKLTIERARTEFNEINGVIHIADADEDCPLNAKTRDSASRVLDVKIKRTLAVSDATRDNPLDFFALVFSGNLLTPSSEQVDSAGGNAFLDAFATGCHGKGVVAINLESNTQRSPKGDANALIGILSRDSPPMVMICSDELVEEIVSASKGTRGAESVAPNADIEDVLIGWWRELLNVNEVGLDADFFDLGGHSLIGVQLLSRIKKTYGVNLGLSILFEARTVKQLSELIRSSKKSAQPGAKPWSPLVPIQSKGTLPPLYVISGLGGNVLKFYTFAFHLGQDQPIYGLLPRGLDGRDSYHRRIEDMAADYVSAIRAKQAAGPYHLAGYSFGGIVTFEVAQQLARQGGEVGVVALLDTGEWHYRDRVSKSLRPGERLDIIREHFRAMLFDENRSDYLKKLLEARYSKLKYQFFKTLGRSVPRNVGSIEEVNAYAAAQYQPSVFPGKLTLFRSIKRAPGEGTDEFLGWKQYARDGVEVHHIPSTHFNMLQEPAVTVLAKELQSCLNRA